MTAPTRWWWLRHAPIADSAGRLYGQADVDCDTSDTETYRALAAMLPPDPVWLVSPLKRTHATMRALAAAAGLDPEPIVEADFAEQNFGLWQRRTWAEMEALDPSAYAAFWRAPTRTAPPEGESFVSLMRRTRNGIERQNARLEGRDILAVSHGGTIRAAVALALGLTPEAAMALVVDNLSLTLLERVADGPLRGRGGAWLVRGVNLPCRWILPKPAC
jgi:alpha-ribazole phosphatase